jgi:uncharacterized membrane protein YqjE
MPDQDTSELGKAIQEVSEKAALLVHEEIELAKAEIFQKGKSLLRGAVIGGIAGVFLFFALIYFLHFVALALADLYGANAWAGYLTVSGALVFFGLLGAFIAYRSFKKGTPPTPQLAIEEAQLIKQTIQHAEGSAR